MCFRLSMPETIFFKNSPCSCVLLIKKGLPVPCSTPFLNCSGGVHGTCNNIDVAFDKAKLQKETRLKSKVSHIKTVYFTHSIACHPQLVMKIKG